MNENDNENENCPSDGIASRFTLLASRSTRHSTPLALWRGVGGEAYSLMKPMSL